MKPTTLCFPINKKGEVLLGMKRRGFGKGKFNGFGGKLQDKESFRECAVRELEEEVSLMARPEEMEPVGFLDFRFPHEEELTHICWIYLVRTFEGIPLTSEEMVPQWFLPSEVPYKDMWAGDESWIPLILEGKKIKGYITFGPDNEQVEGIKIEEVEDLDEVHGECIKE